MAPLQQAPARAPQRPDHQAAPFLDREPCVCEVGLSGPSYINMCKILLGLASSKTYAPHASLSLYHATLSLNKHLSNSRVSTELSEEYIVTLSSYIKFLLRILQFFSDESPTLLLPAGTTSGGIFRLPFGGGSSGDGAVTQGSSVATGDAGFRFALLKSWSSLTIVLFSR